MSINDKMNKSIQMSLECKLMNLTYHFRDFMRNRYPQDFEDMITHLDTPDAYIMRQTSYYSPHDFVQMSVTNHTIPSIYELYLQYKDNKIKQDLSAYLSDNLGISSYEGIYLHTAKFIMPEIDLLMIALFRHINDKWLFTVIITSDKYKCDQIGFAIDPDA